MAHLQVPADDYWRAQGVDWMAADVMDIQKRLKEYDPALRVGIEQGVGTSDGGARWVVYRFTFNAGLSPIRKVENPDGSFRELDGRLLVELAEGDMQRLQLSYDDFLERRRKHEASKAREHANFRTEIAKDLHRAAALDGAILAPRVSMHVSNRDRRKSGLIVPGR